MTQKGFAPIIFILGIVLVSAGIVGGALYIKNSKQSKSPSTATQQIQSTPAPQKTEATDSAETASWKTYTNVKHGYTIKYSPGWHMVTGNEQGEDLITFCDEQSDCNTRPVYMFVKVSSTTEPIPSDLANQPTLKIFNHNGKQFLISTTATQQGISESEIANFKNYVALFNLFLSTFKFTDDIPTPDDRMFSCGRVDDKPCPKGYTCYFPDFVPGEIPSGLCRKD